MSSDALNGVFSGYICNNHRNWGVCKTGDCTWDIASEQMLCFLSISISSEKLAVGLKTILIQ